MVENFESSNIGAAFLWEKKEATSPLLTEESSGQETVEGTQKPIIQPIPINLYPGAITQPKNRPLLVASSLDQVYILPTPETYPTPETPIPKATQFALPWLSNFKKLVATVQNSATTSKKMAAAHIAWHSGWVGCWFGFGAPEHRHSYKLRQFQQPPKA